MKILKRLFCVHDYRLKFTCEVDSGSRQRRLKIEECKKCNKIKKSTI